MCAVPRGGGPLARLKPPSCPQVLGHLKQPQNNRIHQHPFHFQSPLLQDPVGYQGEHRRSETEAKAPAQGWRLKRLETEPALETPKTHLHLSPSWRQPLMWQKANTPPSNQASPQGLLESVLGLL